MTGAIGWAAAGGIFEANGSPNRSGGTALGSGASGGSEAPTPVPTPTQQPPIGGTELYGFLPYWEMNATMAAYLKGVPVSTLALFSVTATGSGSIKTNEIGYRRITGAIGRGLIADAHARGQRVDLVFTSFGYSANDRLFGADPVARGRHEAAAAQLATLAFDLGVDGLAIDVEQIHAADLDGYGAFLEDLRFALGHPADPGTKPIGSISVATTADHEGALAALEAVAAGADRVFLMGYDYHWSGSSAGASSPIHSRDTSHDLISSIVDYVQTGVPRARILLGLPLYGMSWPVGGPNLGDAALGRGTTWIPAQHVKQLTTPGFAPLSDDPETAEWFVTSTVAPSPSPSPGPTAGGNPGAGASASLSAGPSPSASGPLLAYVATFYDSPRTLLPKLELARSQGLAGAGFWALGYERGLPGYLELMRDFRSGRVGPG